MSKGRRKSNHVSGFVSILGRPNTGKSTLLNALIGEKVAIVTDKPQTTRSNIQGVWTTPESQVVFLDTPGIHEGTSLINRKMMESIGEALDDRDLLLYLLDSSRAVGEEDRKALELVKNANSPAIAVLTKIDLLPKANLTLPLLERCRAMHEFSDYIPVSAVTGAGMDDLRKAILTRMPRGPAWFPEDHITDQPERFLAAELIREKILSVTRQEVPHSVAVLVDDWKTEGRLVRIGATIHVERPGQKAILVGARGSVLKRVGTEARLELEKLVGGKVFLTLFVKVHPKWREDSAFLKELDWHEMVGRATGPEE
jgi:GTPase